MTLYSSLLPALTQDPNERPTAAAVVQAIELILTEQTHLPEVDVLEAAAMEETVKAATLRANALDMVRSGFLAAFENLEFNPIGYTELAWHIADRKIMATKLVEILQSYACDLQFEFAACTDDVSAWTRLLGC